MIPLRRVSVMRVGDIVQTPTGQRAQIESFDADGRAEVRYYNEAGMLMASQWGEASIWPHLLKIALAPHRRSGAGTP